MGTSASSKGPKSGVALVPPWVGPSPGPAEPARFGPARTSLGGFGQSGSADALRRGLGHYAKRGLGGGGAGTARFSRTAELAGGFADVLQALRDGTPIPSDIPLDPADLAGKSQQEVADAIIEAVAPADGSQDAEASRDSAARAFAEVLAQDPNADMTALTVDQVEFFFERFLANDLVARIQLDVGSAVIEKAPDAVTGLNRLQQMQDFVRQQFAASVRELKAAGQRLTQGTGNALARAAISATLTIFEGWVE